VSHPTASSSHETSHAEARRHYDTFAARGVKLNLTRGKPSARQLDLSNALLSMPGDADYTAGSIDTRNYGDLQGRNKAETAEKYGVDQVKLWRRSYDTPPPPVAEDDPRHPRFDPRYATLPPDLLPATECLADVVARMLPYWYDHICIDLLEGRQVLVAAHGNSLRALVKHLDGISDADIVSLEIPTGVPLVFELDERLRPVSSGYLGAS